MKMDIDAGTNGIAEGLPPAESVRAEGQTYDGSRQGG
jgi:hypothetical protein